MTRSTIHSPALKRVTPAPVFAPEKTWRMFAVVIAVLGLLYAALDLSVNGPLAMWTFELAVVRPVESAYGFDAEWESVAGHASLVIRETAPGGRFDRAGIRRGYAFAPARCGWFALGGGWYALLSDARRPVDIALQTVPGDLRTERSFVVR
ncbi:MAG TPA: hypothetical protein VEK57_15630 [Thermoanaerobaculia bacterium]|nr:hypothetical protein [Thermoanaerobaculia bacterium]